MAEAGDPLPARIDSLPDSLLGKIFVAADLDEGPTITRVSQRWRRVFYTEPELWRSIVLSPNSLSRAEAAGQAAHWFDAQAGLLRRIGGLVQHMRVDDLVQVSDPALPAGLVAAQQLAAQRGSDWRLGSSLLAHLSPGTLQSLHLTVAPLDGPALAALQRLSGLSELTLHFLGDPPGGIAAALPSLTRLQALTVTGGSMPHGLFAALRPLRHLTALTCTSTAPLPDLSALFPLTQLRRLSWEEEQRPGALQADVQQLLARLPHLDSWTIGSSEGSVWHGNMRVAGAALARCRGETERSTAAAHAEPSAAHTVELSGIQRLPSLQLLLAAVLPPGTSACSLCSLSILQSRLFEPAVQGCSWLGQLTYLMLSMCTFPASPAAQVIEALLRQAPRLRSLTLTGCFRDELLPSALISCTGLRHLSLQGNDLAQLPAGPYLCGLEALTLTFNSFSALPPALSAAANLTKLLLEDNNELALVDADVDALLRLPHLRRLGIGITPTPPRVLGRLFRGAPDLEID